MGSFELRPGAQIGVVVAATFLGFLGIGAILPVLGPHVRRDLGQSDLVVGLAIGIFSFVALAGRLISGPFTDMRGRKLSYITGLSLCSLSGLLYLLPFGVYSVFAGRIVQGLGEAFLFTGAAAWIVELGGPDRQARSLSYLSSGIWGGISVGPVIGQMLGTFPAAALMLTLTPLPAILAMQFLREEYTPPAKRKSRGWRGWIPRSAWLPGLTLGFANVHYPCIAGFLVLHLASSGNSGGPAFAAYAAMILLSRFFLGGLPDRLSPAITYYFGVTLMTLGLLVIATKPPAAVAIAAAALVGFGFSFPWPSVATVVLKKTPSTERASALGAVSASVDAFVGGSSFLAGHVAKTYGYPSVYVMGACGVVISSLIASRFLLAQETREPVTAPAAQQQQQPQPPAPLPHEATAGSPRQG